MYDYKNLWQYKSQYCCVFVFHWITVLRYWYFRKCIENLYTICHTYLILCFSTGLSEQVVLTLWLMSLCVCSAAMGVPVVLQHFPLWDCVRRLLGSVSAGRHRHSRGHAAGWWGHSNPYLPMFSEIKPLIYIHSILSSAECQGQQLTNVMMMIIMLSVFQGLIRLCPMLVGAT